MGDSSAHTKIPLKTIPEPEPSTRAVFIAEVAPVIKGVGDIDLVCGKCGEILIEGITDGQVQNIVIRCPKCNAYNDIGGKLNFAEVKQKIAEHLKTALGVEEFEITFAKQEENIWKVNVEFLEKVGFVDMPVSALFSIDVVTGEVKEFKKGYSWRF